MMILSSQLAFLWLVCASSLAHSVVSTSFFHHPPHSVTNVRGGETATTKEEEEEDVSRPSWMKLDRETLREYMELARQKHSKAVQSAQDAYFYHKNNADDATATASSEIGSVEVDRRSVQPPAGWSLPDFAKDLQNEIKVTSGAKGDGNDKATPLFSPEECAELVQASENHFATNHGGEWTTLKSGQFPVAGFWIKSIPEVHRWFNRMVQHRLFPLLAREFPDFLEKDVTNLVVDNAYLFKYTPETGRRTDVHTDSGCLSFTIAVGGDFEGGGTWVEGLGTVDMTAGHVTIRPGGLRHCGQAIHKGTRYIIGGFCMHRHKVEYVRLLIVLGLEFKQQRQLEKAEKAYLASICLNPHFDGAYTHLAATYQLMGRNDVAAQVLEHCLEKVNPGNGEVAYTLGVHYMENTNPPNMEGAQACFETCLEADDCDVEAMMGMAQICNARQDAAGEQAWYERVVKTPGASNKDAGSAYCNLGVLCPDQERLCFEKAVELSPDNFSARYSLGSVYATSNEWTMAVDQYRQAIDILRQKDASKNNNNEDADILRQTLVNLYRCAVALVQQESQQQKQPQPSSREAMMERLRQLMGDENFQQLAAGANSG